MVEHDKSSKKMGVFEEEDHERLLLAARAMGGGIWDLDIERGTLYCDRQWHRILGLHDDHPRITTIDQFSRHIHPDDVEEATHTDPHTLNSLIEQDERYHIEFRIIWPNGDVRWVRSAACLVRNAVGHLRAVGFITDITEAHMEEAISGSLLHAGAHSEPKVEAPHDDIHSVNLTDKERECLRWVSIGKTAWETAAILGRSQRTVEFHLSRAMRKLEASNKVHAAVIAMRDGLL